MINSGYIDENDIQIFYYDDLFNKLLEKNSSYKDLIRIVHYIVFRVIKQGFRDENDIIIQNKFGYFKNAIYDNIEKLKNSNSSLWENDEEYENFFK